MKRTNVDQTKLAYSVQEAVDATSLGRTTIFNHIRSGKIKATRVCGRTLIPAESLHALINGEG